MTIRPYVDGDLDTLLDVWYQASVIAHPFLSADFLEQERTEIAERWLPNSETAVYEIDGTVVGFISMIGNEVGGLFVDPGQQGRGIGTVLMDHVRSSRPFVELDVFEANAIGRRFYAAYGFGVIGRAVDETTGRPELRLRMES